MKCNRHEDKVGFCGLDGCYCKEVGAFVEEIGNCSIWKEGVTKDEKVKST
jgi:hypothetical protein